MARKRSNPIDDPPTASSSDEEEEEEEEEEVEEEASSEEAEEGEGSSSSSEEEEAPRTQASLQTQKSPIPKKPEMAALSTADDESDDSGSESDSDSDDTDSGAPTPNVKPIATKPMEDASNAKKPRSKPVSTPVKATSAATKRASESEPEVRDAKRAKKKAGDEGSASVAEEVKKTGEDSKKQLFQRLFSEDDEIAVLKGMLDYYAKKGADPSAEMNAFYDFVKKSIHADVNKAQLMDKIRRLKKKFENNDGKKGKKGEDKVFTKPHEQTAFELSKKIWGEDGISGKVESSAAKSNGKAKGNAKAAPVIALRAETNYDKKANVGEPMEVDKKGSNSGVSFFDKRFGGGSSVEDDVLRHGLDMIGGEKRAALEQRWKKLHIAELELFLERNDLIKEQAKTLLECYKSEAK